jgi:hypothetical protein
MPRRFEPLDEAKKVDRIAISMKNDWRRIFAFEWRCKVSYRRHELGTNRGSAHVAQAVLSLFP